MTKTKISIYIDDNILEQYKKRVSSDISTDMANFAKYVVEHLGDEEKTDDSDIFDYAFDSLNYGAGSR